MKTPRYQDIAHKILDGISSGRLGVGDLLGSEEELSAQFNVSRGTIRQTLAMLEEEGFVLRRQRIGTRILSRFPAKGRIESDQILRDWTRYCLDYPLQVTSVTRCVPPTDTVPAARDTGQQPWLLVSGLRYPVGSRVPVSWCEAYIPPDFADIGDAVPQSPVPLFSLIEQRHGRLIKTISVEIRSVVLSPLIADRLGAEPGGAALQLIRTFKDAGQKTVEVAVNTHPSDRFSYRIEIVREQGATEHP